MRPNEAIRLLKRVFKHPESKKLLKPFWRKENERSGIPSTGQCYIATESLYFLCGGVESGLKPRYAKYEGGMHWWLVDKKGKIFDPTKCQYGGEEPPYDLGVNAAFVRNSKEDKPSRRAVTMIKMVNIYKQDMK